MEALLWEVVTLCALCWPHQAPSMVAPTISVAAKAMFAVGFMLTDSPCLHYSTLQGWFFFQWTGVLQSFWWL
ncbi:hypothetical protein CBP34_02600 [Acidovorax carolinensis]|uniref:Uncharacterized protein n=1 Tax=Acidovorax carolinensis TaxID=553814 RepID=A0A240U065_9BURK|nr:hypothetical protein CBP34_02600 [Acidovorax carolinensis]